MIQGASAANGTVSQLADSQLGSLLEQFANARFSQSDESSADQYGFNLLKTKQINPQAAVSSLEKLAALGDSGGIMSGHPSSQKRADKLKKQISKQ